MNRYQPGSNFESCPAATGPSQCTHFPDGSHRCGEARDHYTTDTRPSDERTHRCTCEAEWTALMGSIGKLFKTVLDPPARLTAKLVNEYVDRTKADSDQELRAFTEWIYRHGGEDGHGGEDVRHEVDAYVARDISRTSSC